MDAAFRGLETDGLFRVRRWAPSDFVVTQAAFVETCVAAGLCAIALAGPPRPPVTIAGVELTVG